MVEKIKTQVVRYKGIPRVEFEYSISFAFHCVYVSMLLRFDVFALHCVSFPLPLRCVVFAFNRTSIQLCMAAIIQTYSLFHVLVWPVAVITLKNAFQPIETTSVRKKANNSSSDSGSSIVCAIKV